MWNCYFASIILGYTTIRHDFFNADFFTVTLFDADPSRSPVLMQID